MATALLLAWALALSDRQADQSEAAVQYRVAGVAQAECRGGLSVGLAILVRRTVGCHMAIARKVDLAAPDLEAELKRIYTSRSGRVEVQGASDELLAHWAKDPSSSLAPRADFRPVRVENLEFAEAAGFDRYVNPTGGFGLATHDATALIFRGRLISETPAGSRAYNLTGRFAFANGYWALTALKISPASP